MYRILLMLGLIIAISSITRANNDDNLVLHLDRGTALLDSGLYNEALIEFKKAYQINPESDKVNYQLAYTYLKQNDYKKTQLYSQKVLWLNSGYMEQAIILSATVEERMGNSENAIQLYEDGIKRYPTSYMLYYNLALISLSKNNMEKAEWACIHAIESNPTRSSNHLLLSYIMNRQGNILKSILPIYYFLLLEPETSKATEAYEFLNLQLSNLSIKNKAIPPKDSTFFNAEKTLAIMLGDNYFTADSLSYIDEMADKTNKIFTFLGKTSPQNGFWWNQYVRIFNDLSVTGNVLTYSYFISQSKEEKLSAEWLQKHPQQVDIFSQWLYLKLDF